MRHGKHYETDNDTFPAEGYRVARYDGVAWYVLGWELEADEDTEWSGIENRTGRVVCRMVGDDTDFSIDPADVSELERGEFCGACGQIGCAHDGYERGEE